MTHQSSHVIIHKVKDFAIKHAVKIIAFATGFSGGAWFF